MSDLRLDKAIVKPYQELLCAMSSYKLNCSHWVEPFCSLVSDLKTLFLPYFLNKTTLVANNYIISSLKPYYLIKYSIKLQKIEL